MDATHAAAHMLERMFRGAPGWEHPTLMGLIGALTVEQATWRPGPGRRCIWELVRHMLSWRSVVTRRLEGEADATEEPWPALPQGDPARAWASDLSRLADLQARLAAAVRALDPRERHPHPDLAALPRWAAAVGLQFHDSYHLGQIALLRGMQGLPTVA